MRETSPRGIQPHLLFFGLGAVSLVVQAALIREFAAVTHGTELAFGLVLGLWLFWIGCGALWGSRCVARLGQVRLHLSAWVALGALAPLGQIELVRHAGRLLGLAPGLIISWPQTLLVASVALAPFCVMIGFTFPLGCRLVREQSSRGIGSLYMVEAAGALGGGLLFSLLLVGRVGHLPLCAFGATTLIGLSAWLHRGAARALGLVAAALLLAASPLVARWDEASRRRQLAAALPGQEIVAVFDTPYEQVALARLADQVTVYGDGLPVATVPDIYETRARVYSLLAQAPAARRWLVLGSPATGLAQELAAALAAGPAPGATVTLVHPDKLLLANLKAQLGADFAVSFDRQVRFVVDDGRSFLRGAGGQFDVIFVDAPDPTAAYVNRLFTTQFFAAAQGALGPRGMVGFRLGSSSAHVGRELSELAVSVGKAVAAVFPSVVMTAGEDSYFFAGGTLAGLTVEQRVITERLAAMPGARPYGQAISNGYDAGRLHRLAEQLTAGRDAITNSDDQPSSYYYGSVLWDRFSSDRPAGASWLTRLFATVRAFGPVHCIAGIALLAGLWLALRRIVGRHAAQVDVGLSVALSGACAMALYLVLLLRYQSACGALYERLAAMSAVFMFGTAVGCGIVARLAPGLRRPGGVVGGMLVGTAALALALVALLPALDSMAPWAQQLAYAVSFACAGACLGGSLPANAQALLARFTGGEANATAHAGGLMDAADHFGATLGALVTGTLVLPAIGATATLQAIAAVAATAGALWLSAGYFRRTASVAK